MKELESEEFMRACSTGEVTPPSAEQLAQHGLEATEFEFSQKLVQVLRNREQLEVKGLIQAALLERGLPPEQSFPRQPLSRWWVWLALGLLGVGLAVVANQFLFSPQATARRLANDYLEPLENVIYTKEDLNTTKDLHAGMEAYSAGHYALAIAQLKPYFQKTADRNAGLFLAISYQLSNQPAAAERILREVLPQPGPVGLAARWYLALCLLQQGEIDQGNQQLQNIDPDSPFYLQAQRLQDALNP